MSIFSSCGWFWWRFVLWELCLVQEVFIILLNNTLLMKLRYSNFSPRTTYKKHTIIYPVHQPVRKINDLYKIKNQAEGRKQLKWIRRENLKTSLLLAICADCNVKGNNRISMNKLSSSTIETPPKSFRNVAKIFTSDISQTDIHIYISAMK